MYDSSIVDDGPCIFRVNELNCPKDERTNAVCRPKLYEYNSLTWIYEMDGLEEYLKYLGKDKHDSDVFITE